MSETVRKQFAGLHVKAASRTAEADAMPLGIVDLDKEITLSVADATVPVLQGHDWAQRPVGVATIRSDTTRAHAKIRFLTSNAGEEAYVTVKELRALGVEQAVSLGFLIDKARPANAEEHQRGAVRVLERITPIELSLVVLGAVPGATIRDVKCTACAAKQAESPELEQLARKIQGTLRRSARILANGVTLQERQGALALDVAEKATRWLTGGRAQEPPAVKFYDHNGKVAGRYVPGEPDTVFVSRGLSNAELIETIGHEVSHWLRPWDRDETVAQLDGQRVARRYFESLTGGN